MAMLEPGCGGLKQPGIVLVIKHSYDSNSISYVSGNNAGWYLSEGGATRLAEKGAILIMGAIGEVISCRQGGWWSGNVLSTAAHPGDTVVVPERPVIGDICWKSLLPGMETRRLCSPGFGLPITSRPSELARPAYWSSR